MIRRKEERNVEYREHMRDGDGTVQLNHIIHEPGELYDKGRLFAHLHLEPGCSIGWHIHEKDEEIFYILNGTAEYSDNGNLVTLTAGDVSICPAGTGHSIRNIGTDALDFVALIIYK